MVMQNVLSGTDAQSGAASIRVLIVEDESLVAMLIEDYLREPGVTDPTLAQTP